MSIIYTYFFDEGGALGAGGPRVGDNKVVVAHRSPLSPIKVCNDFCHRPSGEILIVADANLFTRGDSAGLAKRRNNPELMIGCTYKFKVF